MTTRHRNNKKKKKNLRLSSLPKVRFKVLYLLLELIMVHKIV